MLAFSHTAIWHSLVALSSFHEHFVFETATGCTQEFSFWHYNRGIAKMMSVKPTGSVEDMCLHLTSCILFLTIEVSHLTLVAC